MMCASCWAAITCGCLRRASAERLRGSSLRVKRPHARGHRLASDITGSAEQDQGKNQHRTGDDLLFFRRHAGEAERVLYEGEYQNGDEHAAQGAAAAKNI